MSVAAVAIHAAALAQAVLTLPPATPRLMIAVAGPPASGKSTLAHALTSELLARGASAVTVPMDGFHLDNAVLRPRGLLPRKGAPETFDAAGFLHAMRRLATEEAVILPAFDRTRDIAIAGRISVSAEDRIAVVEGNYLLFDEAPWRELVPLWHGSVFVETPIETLRDRLIRRWQRHGLSPVDARERAEGNDLANAERILRKALPATLTLA
jgi:pantothenate kinase